MASRKTCHNARVIRFYLYNNMNFEGRVFPPGVLLNNDCFHLHVTPLLIAIQDIRPRGHKQSDKKVM